MCSGLKCYTELFSHFPGDLETQAFCRRNRREGGIAVRACACAAREYSANYCGVRGGSTGESSSEGGAVGFMPAACRFSALPPPRLVGKYWKCNCVVTNFRHWLPVQSETLRRFVHPGPCGRRYYHSVGYAASWEPRQPATWSPNPSYATALARCSEKPLSVRRPCGGRGVERRLRFCRIRRALRGFH